MLRVVRRGKSLSRCSVGLSGFLQGVDDPHELLSGMRDGNVVVLALSALLGEIGSKGRVPVTDILGSVEDSEAKITRASLLHMSIGS